MSAAVSQASQARLNPVACIRESLGYLDRPASKAVILLVVLIANSVMPVLYSAMLKSSLDSLYTLEGSSFVRDCALLFAAFFAGGSLAWAGATLRLNLVESISVEQRKKILAAALAMPLMTHEKSSRGDLLSRMTADVDQSSRILTAVYLTLDLVLRATAAIAYMVFLSWQVGAVTIASSIVVIFVTRRTNAAIPEKSKAVQKALGDLSSGALNSLEGIAVVKSFSAQDTVSRSFGARAGEVFAAGISLAKSTLTMRASTTLAAFLPTVAAFAYGGYMATVGEISPGSVLAIMNLGDSVSILVSLGLRWSEVQRSVGAYERVRAAISATPDFAPVYPAERQGDVAAGCPAAAPAISVNRLSFEYQPGRPILKDVSFEILPGKKAALVGRSGCGKSTLLKVLAGLYAATPGSVFVNGLDMHYQRLADGRDQVTYVPQEPFLLSGSVRDNLTLASESAGDDELLRALDAADSADFVRGLSDGLDSQVGEKGSLLSGGQRQRLCLARGLLRRTPILLLDEPTSSLDRESEARVVGALSEMRGFTCLTVTHRANLAEGSDFILVMDDGRIIEAGTHAQLMENRSLYWSFYSGETSFSSSPRTGAPATERRKSR